MHFYCMHFQPHIISITKCKTKKFMSHENKSLNYVYAMHTKLVKHYNQIYFKLGVEQKIFLRKSQISYGSTGKLLMAVQTKWQRLYAFEYFFVRDFFFSNSNKSFYLFHIRERHRICIISNQFNTFNAAKTNWWKLRFFITLALAINCKFCRLLLSSSIGENNFLFRRMICMTCFFSTS